MSFDGLPTNAAGGGCDAIPIPKSATPARQAANLDVFRFELTDREITAISGLGQRRLGGDPDTHEEF